jgi:hypothetical protein
LNGIAYDPKKKTMYITGKLWPEIFEIRIEWGGMRDEAQGTRHEGQVTSDEWQVTSLPTGGWVQGTRDKWRVTSLPTEGWGMRE